MKWRKTGRASRSCTTSAGLIRVRGRYGIFRITAELRCPPNLKDSVSIITARRYSDIDSAVKAVSEVAEKLDAPREKVPLTITAFVGNERNLGPLKLRIGAARKRGTPLDHVLIYGPPGLGKTTLAKVIAAELDTKFLSATATALSTKGALLQFFSRIGEGDVVFIDEIHRIPKRLCECLYTALENGHFDTAKGSIQLPGYTAIGATTHVALLPKPLRDRFPIHVHLNFYSPRQLAQIADFLSEQIGITLDEEAAFEVACRSRGTPRLLVTYLAHLRDHAEVHGIARINRQHVNAVLRVLGVDEWGLTETDRRYLTILHHSSGPVGVEQIASILGEPRDTIENVTEPYLLREGFIERTPKGRRITGKGIRALKGRPEPCKRRIGFRGGQE